MIQTPERSSCTGVMALPPCPRMSIIYRIPGGFAREGAEIRMLIQVSPEKQKTQL